MHKSIIPWLTAAKVFPPVHHASDEGLLCLGGDLSMERLLLAYRSGIFPWYSDDQPILWWSPDPRCVMIPQDIRISHSVRKSLRRGEFTLTKNQAFREVIAHCRDVPRHGQDGTWITPEMEQAYIALHDAGYADSHEAWQDGMLVGGLYGVRIGKAFFGESMFSLMSNASKAAFAGMIHSLVEEEVTLCDCQVANDHTLSLGAIEISRGEYLLRLAVALDHSGVRVF